MTLAILSSAVLGLALFVVVLTLLAGAIRHSHLAIDSRRHPARDPRRPGVRTHIGWTARPDAS